MLGEKKENLNSCEVKAGMEEEGENYTVDGSVI